MVVRVDYRDKGDLSSSGAQKYLELLVGNHGFSMEIDVALNPSIAS